jgi:hypothetical protein
LKSARRHRDGEWSARGVWLTSTNSTIAELVQDWSSAQGQQLMPLMMADVAIHPIDWRAD